MPDIATPPATEITTIARAQARESTEAATPIDEVERSDKIVVANLRRRVDAYFIGAHEHQERRHEEWKENYMLYRNKPIINRITQRQSVSIPMMKETIKTLLANMDEAPDIAFEEMGNDEQKEIYLNAMWEKDMKRNKLVIKDIVDKKQVLLYGRSFMKLNLLTGSFQTEVVDPVNFIVDRYVDPADIDTAHYACHRNIFRTLTQLRAHPLYDKREIEKLGTDAQTPAGLQTTSVNFAHANEQAAKQQAIGDITAAKPQLGETYFEVQENYIKVFDPKIVEFYRTKEDGFVLFVVVTVQGKTVMAEAMKTMLGVNFLPVVSWGDDVEATDFWSDGAADVTRPSAKVVNAWYSQLVENRTMRNFGMHYYDATIENFNPSSFVPQPWGWVPVQGDPNKVIKKVDTPDLSESIDEINFVVTANERATAATATIKGQTAKGTVTLGEIELVDQKALERITASAKFYRIARQQLAEKYAKIMIANADRLTNVKLQKKGSSGKWFSVEISPRDFKSKDGFNVAVTSSAEQEAATLDTLQKFQAVAVSMPNNKPFQKAKKEKELDLLDLSPEVKKEIMDFEEEQADALPNANELASQVGPGQPAGAPAPGGGGLTPLPAAA